MEFLRPVFRGWVWAPSLLAITALGWSGCSSSGPERVEVTGRVVFTDGTPLPLGIIEMQHVDLPWTARGEVKGDGEFEVSTLSPGDGAVPGRYRVAITQLIIAEDLGSESHDHGHRLDPKYFRPETSELEVVIESGKSNRLTLTVESPDLE